MQISRFFLLVCAAVFCAAVLPLRAAEPAAQPSPAPVALPPGDSESIAKAREALRQKMKELEAQPPASTNAPASAAAKPAQTKPKATASPAPAVAKPAEAKPKPTASKPEGKPTADTVQKKPAAVKATPAFPPIQAPPPAISADKQQRLVELLRKYKAEELTPEEYHLQRAKIMSEP
jgi:hypothetical protein